MSSRINFSQKLNNYLNASYPLLWVQTHEEARVCANIYDAFQDPKDPGFRARTIYEWDAVRGLTRFEANRSRVKIPETVLIKKMFEYIDATNEERLLFVLKDFHPYFVEPTIRRYLRNITAKLKSKSIAIIFISPICAIPEELIKDIQLLEFVLPDEKSLEERLLFVQRAAEATKDPNKNHDFSMTPEIVLRAVEAGKGLTDSEAENAYTLALVENKAFNDSFVATVFSEKVLQVKKNGLLTYVEPDVTFDQVGGLNGLKTWIRQRAKAYLPEARSYGLPYARGILLAGIPGTGKTLLAKATSAELKLPLFQLDVGSLFGKLVGDTEKNFRAVIQMVDGIGSCILFIDEIERSLNANAVSGQGDSGTSSRSFGTLLTWLSDHKTPVFVIGTSNNFTALPPEMIRKGRFDELFWLDLPTEKDLLAIFSVLLTRYKREPAKFNLKALARASKGFTGAEIEQCIVSAMFYCFSDNGKEINDKALLAAINASTPQSKISEAQLTHMRLEAQGKLRLAAEDGSVCDVTEELRNIAL